MPWYVCVCVCACVDVQVGGGRVEVGLETRVHGQHEQLVARNRGSACVAHNEAGPVDADLAWLLANPTPRPRGLRRLKPWHCRAYAT